MQNFLAITVKLIKGVYLCTVGYFTGEYNPTLYTEWKKSKEEFNEEVNKANKFDSLLAKASDHLDDNVNYSERKQKYQALKISVLKIEVMFPSIQKKI